jgi:hypothetical protein
MPKDKIKPKQKPAYTNKRDDIDWVQIGKEYCAGASQTSLAIKHGINRRIIAVQIDKNQWKQDVSAIIQKEVAAKVAGVNNSLTPEQKQHAVDTESDRLVIIAKEHQVEISDGRKVWPQLHNLVKVKVKRLAKQYKDTGTFDIKELDLVIKMQGNIQDKQIAAQEREAKANGIDLMPHNSSSVNMGDEAFQSILEMAASAKKNVK